MIDRWLMMIVFDGTCWCYISSTIHTGWYWVELSDLSRSTPVGNSGITQETPTRGPLSKLN